MMETESRAMTTPCPPQRPLSQYDVRLLRESVFHNNTGR